MGKHVDLVGKTFGRLTVVEFHGMTSDGMRRVWRCACECGGTKVATTSALTKGVTSSCGCKLRDVLVSRNSTHGKSRTRLYGVWCSMMNRCNNQNNAAYPRYGGRGIVVCGRWKDYALFEEDMGLPPPGLTLERKDVNGPYSPENCVWATYRQQNSNRRDNVLVCLPSGEMVTLMEASRRLGVHRNTLTYHLNRHGSYLGASYASKNQEG